MLARFSVGSAWNVLPPILRYANPLAARALIGSSSASTKAGGWWLVDDGG